jgi:hypothetical protein
MHTGRAISLLAAILLPRYLMAQTTPLLTSPRQGGGDPVKASVYLDGNIKGTAESRDETSVATGSLVIALRRYRWSVSTQLNIAAKRDTIRTRPGQSMLVPGTGGFTSGLAEGRLRLSPNPRLLRWAGGRLFARGYTSVSSLLWELPADGTSSAEPAVANAVGLGLGAAYQVASGRIGSGSEAPRLGLSIEAGFTQRLLYGDVMEPAFDVRRTAFLNSGSRRFSGYELGFQAQYNTIRGSLVYYNFPRQAGVRGLTRGQVAAGFAIAAPILEGELAED